MRYSYFILVFWFIVSCAMVEDTTVKPTGELFQDTVVIIDGNIDTSVVVTPEPEIPTLTEELQGVFEKYKLMGMSVGLIAKGDVAYEHSFGYANWSNKASLTNDKNFRIASISKFFASLAVMKLWEEGKLELDVDVSHYLGWTLVNPKFPEDVITLRHLIDHQSGIRDGSGYSSFLGSMIKNKLSIEELFSEQGSHYTSNMFATKPGTFFSYSNCAWGLVASVVEKASGMPFDEYCKKVIFDPLELNSSFNPSDIEASDYATLYSYRKSSWSAQVDDYRFSAPSDRMFDGYVPGQNGLIYGPQGSLRTSLSDLLVIGQMLLKEGTFKGTQIIKPETIESFKENPWVYDGTNGDTWDNFWLSYAGGMHLIINKEKGDIIFPDRTMYGHPGIAYGLLSDFYIDPVTQSGVVFITNGSKLSYEYAASTSFYAVEDAVFQNFV